MAATLTPEKATNPSTRDTNQKSENEFKNQGISQKIIDEMSYEINNMISYAIFNGIIINTEVNSLIQDSSIDDLINAHNLLCKNIAPATPKSIEYTKQLNQAGKNKSFFKKLPLLRNLILLSLFFLGTFILTAQSPYVSNDSLDKGIMDNQGISLLFNLGYLSSIAGLGVLFYLLKNVSHDIKVGTLVPEDTVYYISMIVLGIIAGIIASEIISFGKNQPEDINLFNKGVLALIGGFSSDAIFSVLQGIIDRIKNIFTIPNSTN